MKIPLNTDRKTTEMMMQIALLHLAGFLGAMIMTDECANDIFNAGDTEGNREKLAARLTDLFESHLGEGMALMKSKMLEATLLAHLGFTVEDVKKAGV